MGVYAVQERLEIGPSLWIATLLGPFLSDGGLDDLSLAMLYTQNTGYHGHRSGILAGKALSLLSISTYIQSLVCGTSI